MSVSGCRNAAVVHPSVRPRSSRDHLQKFARDIDLRFCPPPEQNRISSDVKACLGEFRSVAESQEKARVHCDGQAPFYYDVPRNQLELLKRLEGLIRPLAETERVGLAVGLYDALDKRERKVLDLVLNKGLRADLWPPSPEDRHLPTLPTSGTQDIEPLWLKPQNLSSTIDSAKSQNSVGKPGILKPSLAVHISTHSEAAHGELSEDKRLASRKRREEVAKRLSRAAKLLRQKSRQVSPSGIDSLPAATQGLHLVQSALHSFGEERSRLRSVAGRPSSTGDKTLPNLKSDLEQQHADALPGLSAPEGSQNKPSRSTTKDDNLQRAIDLLRSSSNNEIPTHSLCQPVPLSPQRDYQEDRLSPMHELFTPEARATSYECRTPSPTALSPTSPWPDYYFINPRPAPRPPMLLPRSTPLQVVYPADYKAARRSSLPTALREGHLAQGPQEVLRCNQGPGSPWSDYRSPRVGHNSSSSYPPEPTVASQKRKGSVRAAREGLPGRLELDLAKNLQTRLPYTQSQLGKSVGRQLSSPVNCASAESQDRCSSNYEDALSSQNSTKRYTASSDYGKSRSRGCGGSEPPSPHYEKSVAVAREQRDERSMKTGVHTTQAHTLAPWQPLRPRKPEHHKDIHDLPGDSPRVLPASSFSDSPAPRQHPGLRAESKEPMSLRRPRKQIHEKVRVNHSKLEADPLPRRQQMSNWV